MTFHHNTNKPRPRESVLGSITLIAFALAGIFLVTLLAVSRNETTSIATAPTPAIDTPQPEATAPLANKSIPR